MTRRWTATAARMRGALALGAGAVALALWRREDLTWILDASPQLGVVGVVSAGAAGAALLVSRLALIAPEAARRARSRAAWGLVGATVVIGFLAALEGVARGDGATTQAAAALTAIGGAFLAAFAALGDRGAPAAERSDDDAETILRVARAAVVSNAHVARRLDGLTSGVEALSSALERGLATQRATLATLRERLEREDAPLERMSAAIERMEERLIREHGRARELLDQQNRALVLQADVMAQRAQRSADGLGAQISRLHAALERDATPDDGDAATTPAASGAEAGATGTSGAQNTTHARRAQVDASLAAFAAAVERVGSFKVGGEREAAGGSSSGGVDKRWMITINAGDLEAPLGDLDEETDLNRDPNLPAVEERDADDARAEGAAPPVDADADAAAQAKPAAVAPAASRA